MLKWPLDFVVVSLLFAPNSIIVLFPRGESGGMNHKRTPLGGGGGVSVITVISLHVLTGREGGRETRQSGGRKSELGK